MRSENLSSNANEELMDAEMMEDKSVEKILGEKEHLDHPESSSLFSGMWIRTLFRRDLLVAFVAFMAYFISTILPLILSFREFSAVSGYYESLISGGLTITPLISLSYPVVLSVMLFDYLHSGASAAALHSFPVTRGKLYRSTLLTGTILLLAPVLIIAIMMFICGRIMPADDTSYSFVINNQLSPAGTFNLMNCLRWFADTALATLFTFAISNLAGIVAGKNSIHALLACLLNALAGIVLVLIDLYSRAFIFGADGTQFTALARKTSPYIWYWTERNSVLSLKHAPMMIMFLGIAVLIMLFTGFLYRRIKLEREQSATVFPVVSDMLVIFCTFCVMSMLGMISAELTPGDHATYPMSSFLFGCIVGGVPSFIVFRMIADSSVRILNLKTLITFIAFCLVTGAVFAFTCFDVTDQAGRVPDPSDVSRVTVSTLKPFNTGITLSESGSVQDVTALQKAVIANKAEASRSDYSSGTMQITMKYKMKDGSMLSRAYYIDMYKLSDVREAAARLASGDEYVKKAENYLRKVIINADSAGIDSSRGYVDIEKEDIRPLLMAYLKDYRKNGSDYYYDLAVREVTSDSDVTFTKDRTGSINVTPVHGDDDLPISDDLYCNIYFSRDDRHVQKFLKKHGYRKALIDSEKEYAEEE